MNSCYSIWPIIHYFIFQVEHNSASLKIIWILLVDEDTLKMADRKAELERKKKRLEEIRAAKSKKVKMSYILWDGWHLSRNIFWNFLQFGIFWKLLSPKRRSYLIVTSRVIIVRLFIKNWNFVYQMFYNIQ